MKIYSGKPIAGKTEIHRRMVKLLKTSEVAETVSVKIPTVWAWCRLGRLPYIELSPRNFRIRETDLEAFLAKRTKGRRKP